MKKKDKKEMSLSEAAGQILPGVGKAFMDLIRSIGAPHDKEVHNHPLGAGFAQKDAKAAEDTTDSETVELPTMTWTKKQITSYMEANSIKLNSGDTKRDLLDKIKWSSK
tara:strand:+ start:148 stop:474 length:327 start_codon:yes stop_codon:yes gene_type:complete